MHVVRHAKAFSRKRYKGDDTLRPLSEEGYRQAEALAECFDRPHPMRVDRVVSSRAVRCLETVAPLAARRQLEVGDLDELAEGSSPRSAVRALVEVAGTYPPASGIIACSHGDVIFGLLLELVRDGIALDGDLSAPKGSVWEVGVADGQIETAVFRPPPLTR